MKKKYLLLIVLLFGAAVLYAMFIGLPGYEIWDVPSTFEPNPMEGVIFEIDATRREGELTIRNKSDHYITIEFSRKAPRIEVLQDDGWHRILSNKHFFAEPWAVEKGNTFTQTIRWSRLLGGDLKPGRYRAVLFHGDGHEDVYYYSTICEFTVA